MNVRYDPPDLMVENFAARRLGMTLEVFRQEPSSHYHRAIAVARADWSWYYDAQADGIDFDAYVSTRHGLGVVKEMGDPNHSYKFHRCRVKLDSGGSDLWLLPSECKPAIKR